MKKIPTPLQLCYEKPGTSTCYLVKLVSKKSGAALGFTTLDADVTFDDGIQTVTYSSTQELRPQNIQIESSFETDNTELLGWFTDVIEQRVMSGEFDSAEMTIYRVAYLRLSAGPEIIAYGTMGEIDLSVDSNGKRKVEYRSLSEQLQQKTIALYSLTCRASYGDERCGMPFVWHTATVASVGDNPKNSFTISGVTAADGFFDLGVLEFLTGDNTGTDIEVETWTSGGAVYLSFVLPYPVQNGDQLRIRQDCDKTEATCKSRGNLPNMRAEHLTPVQDQALMVPGAYIKSVGAQ